MGLRYRRTQMVYGYNAPYLKYRSLDGKASQFSRIPTLPEFITRPL